MIYSDPHLIHTLQQVIEFLGTFAFAISGIRHAAAKHYDWFGGFVCGFAVAIGGGTIRDVMLGVTPFWMTSSLYIICTVLAQVAVIVFAQSLKRLANAWFAFDTLGLALFTIAGIQKTAGGVIRDVLLNNEPVIFHKEIYAMASVLGGLLYWLLCLLHVSPSINVVSTFLLVCVIRFLAVKYHISLPLLKDENEKQ